MDYGSTSKPIWLPSPCTTEPYKCRRVGCARIAATQGLALGAMKNSLAIFSWVFCSIVTIMFSSVREVEAGGGSLAFINCTAARHREL